ncbi:MAG: hypothetical protein HC805_05270 [Alkalinema sp. RL_2_19]|nr:hypothetical protein [Alkalinema sp. RL_2_19]
MSKREQERDKAKKDLQQAQAQIEALTGVFSNIKPWSAMSQDLRDRLPAGMQISEIVQKRRRQKLRTQHRQQHKPPPLRPVQPQHHRRADRSN